MFGVYQENLVVDTGAADRPVVVLNGAFADEMTLLLPQAPEKAEAFDTFGAKVASPVLKAGLNRVKVPVSGCLSIAFSPAP